VAAELFEEFVVHLALPRVLVFVWQHNSISCYQVVLWCLVFITEQCLLLLVAKVPFQELYNFKFLAARDLVGKCPLVLLEVCKWTFGIQVSSDIIAITSKHLFTAFLVIWTPIPEILEHELQVWINRQEFGTYDFAESALSFHMEGAFFAHDYVPAAVALMGLLVHS
jgi:hypothetical protein